MVDKKTTNAVLISVGISILILSLIADLIGLGERQGFEHNQIAGDIVGAFIFALFLFLRQKNNLRNYHHL